MIPLRQFASIGARLLNQSSRISATSRVGPATDTFERQMCRKPQKPTFNARDHVEGPRSTQNPGLVKNLAQTVKKVLFSTNASPLVSAAQKMCNQSKFFNTEKPGPSALQPMGFFNDTEDPRDFNARYVKTGFLGKGGYGKVYKGYRRSDNLPVAIKHTPLYSYTLHTTVGLKNRTKLIPMEAALMLKLQKETGTSAASVNLLDWYELQDELILIMERPDPCLSLFDLIKSRRGPLSEQESKNITKQLVDALIEIHAKGVVHRDIKPANILLQTNSDVPRVRLIDFGCGMHLTNDKYIEYQASYHCIPPEILMLGWYKAEPLTVWQLGVTVFIMLHFRHPFEKIGEILDKTPVMDEALSTDCRNFLSSCLAKDMNRRRTLQSLKDHPWLN